MTVDYDRLVAEVGEWSTDNFGEQPADYPVLGAVEEAGELVRSVLKRAQGIDDDQKYQERDDVGPAAERDAVGDIVIYLADFVFRTDYDDVWLQSNKDFGDDEPETVIQAAKKVSSGIGDLCQITDDTSLEGKNARNPADFVLAYLGHIIWSLEQFCDLRGYDYEQCVVDAWEEVSGRTWDSKFQ
jgi:hypothetical protein